MRRNSALKLHQGRRDEPAEPKAGEKAPQTIDQLDSAAAASKHLKWFFSCEPRVIWSLLGETFDAWNRDNVPRLSAALAYYTVFSIAPLLVLVIAAAGLVFGYQASQGQIFWEIRDLVGDKGATAIQTIIQNAHKPGAGIVASLISIVVLLVGASGVVSELEGGLNTIWGAPPPPGGLKGLVKYRFHLFALVLGIGFVLLVSLILSALISAAATYISGAVPGGGPLLHVFNLLVGFAIITLLFATIYKVLPNVRIAWSDVVVGAVVTALLFSLGKLLIGLYLGKSTIGSSYGAAGSFAIFLAWVYYSAQIFYFGSEFTQVYANRFGSRVNSPPAAQEN